MSNKKCYFINYNPTGLYQITQLLKPCIVLSMLSPGQFTCCNLAIKQWEETSQDARKPKDRLLEKSGNQNEKGIPEIQYMKFSKKKAQLNQKALYISLLGMIQWPKLVKIQKSFCSCILLHVGYVKHGKATIFAIKGHTVFKHTMICRR